LHGLAECTDRHDRIYGLLGLVLRGNNSGYFSADYGEHLATLFQRVMHQSHADLRTGSIAFCRHLRHVLGLPFVSPQDGMTTLSGLTSSADPILPASLQYNIVVRYAGRLMKEIEGSPDRVSDDEHTPEVQTKLSTWEAGNNGPLWSTSGHAQTGDLIYSIDDSCCGVIFRRTTSQPAVQAKRKRGTASAPLFIGRAVAHKPYQCGDIGHIAVKSLLQVEHTFASKLIAEKPLLERPGAPWESHVPLFELWDLTCDIEGTEISSNNRMISHQKTERSYSPSRRKQWNGVPGKKRRFGFQWTSEAPNSQ